MEIDRDDGENILSNTHGVGYDLGYVISSFQDLSKLNVVVGYSHNNKTRDDDHPEWKTNTYRFALDWSTPSVGMRFGIQKIEFRNSRELDRTAGFGGVYLLFNHSNLFQTFGNLITGIFTVGQWVPFDMSGNKTFYDIVLGGDGLFTGDFSPQGYAALRINI